MESKQSINFFQLTMIMMMSTGMLTHVLLVPFLLEAAGRDAWISIVVATLLTLIWNLGLAVLIRQMRGQPLNQWLRQKVGRVIGYALLGMLGVLLFILAAVTLFDMTHWLRMSYLQKTPLLILVVPFLCLCVVNCMRGIYSLRMTASILLCFVVLFGIFVGVSNMERKDWTLLLPMMEHGMGPVWNGVQYAATGYTEVFWVLLLQHRLPAGSSAWKGLSAITIVMLLITLGPLTGAVMEFGAVEASHLRYPAFEEWRLIKIGDYIEHVDFLSLYQWISGSFLRISWLLFLLLELFELHATKKARQRNWTVWTVGGCLVLLFLFPISDMTFLSWLRSYVLPGSGVMLVVFSLVFGVIAAFGKRKKEAEQDEGREPSQAV